MPDIFFRFVDETLSEPDQDILWPKRQSELAAGLDLAAANRNAMILRPGERILIPTGISISLPGGFEAQVRSRSGLSAKHGVVVLNAPGTIDADYRGEIKVILINHGQEDFLIEFGMRIAQLVIAPVIMAEINKVATLSSSKRGEQGFGSTGVNHS